MNMLQETLKKGMHILLLNLNDMELLNVICEVIAEEKLSGVEVWHSIKEYTGIVKARYIGSEDLAEIMRIYRLYDFSDKVIVVSDTEQYGSMFNYVKNGVLTKQEMVNALLYKI